MQYTSVTIKHDFDSEYAQDMLVYELGEIGFESFETTENSTIAYIPKNQFNQQLLNDLLSDFELPVDDIKIAEQPDIDWNKEWEKNYFQPIIIENQCVIHSTFHTNIPTLPYDIIINPQMAFGTGHHQTTSLMLQAILNTNMSNKTVLDMGCGTAILAILAKMRGAKHVLAVDIDDWCVRNSIENIQLNNINDIDVQQGTSKDIEGMHFDIILANINRNILLNDIPQYAKCLTTGGQLFMSGFYTDDIPVLEQKANQHQLTLTARQNKDNWAMIQFTKQ